jgi:hypothetical protein
VSKVIDTAKKVVGAVGTAATIASLVGFKVEGRPVKDKSKPAKVKALGLPWFERDVDGKQYVLWFRIRDVRR